MATVKQIKGSELERLCQQLVDLREALKPFAEFAACLPPVVPGDPRITDDGTLVNVYQLQKNYNITCAHLRQAKALLDRLYDEDNARYVEIAELAATGLHCSHCLNLFAPPGSGALTDDADNVYCSNECYYEAVVKPKEPKEPKEDKPLLNKAIIGFPMDQVPLNPGDKVSFTTTVTLSDDGSLIQVPPDSRDKNDGGST